VIESSPTRTASEGHATVGKKRGDGPSPSHYQMHPGDFVEPVANGEGINQAPQDTAFGL
jgi:hypothetical protein